MPSEHDPDPSVWGNLKVIDRAVVHVSTRAEVVPGQYQGGIILSPRADQGSYRQRRLCLPGLFVSGPLPVRSGRRCPSGGRSPQQGGRKVETLARVIPMSLMTKLDVWMSWCE